MSLRHALLGLLAERAQSGYDLTKKFELSMKRYAWHASHSHIYPELKRMAAEGLVEVVDEGLRGRRTYAITGSGRTELRNWMLSPPTNAVVRNEDALRLFLLSSLDRPDAEHLLGRIIDTAEREVAHMREVVADVEGIGDADGPPLFGHFAAEFGLRYHLMELDWARWALGRLTSPAR
ncbi:DNA-binding PadR family transcriptional regulator [Saccharothrix tamanrassetensis]|uniref:DNA-binding PadR family transcriptional regulator n=1 Tax=Saccharothrix tamanrassetensis TaxID=1051531 RepID=A0A841C5D8_9PSEU|nr:PadR family transcriptional regulator [Saccharothrix tamanrassetensis]MBB5953742.1 DNA-binding PadR family transcriptional regulator [Saccharothrix tamanrassetensis]